MAAILPEPDPAVLKKLRLRIDTDNVLYPGLKVMKIRGKDLNDLPIEVYHLNELEVLDLSPEREACINYRIGRLPAGIGNLSGLRVLMLDTNEMDELPAELTLLTSLEKLTLSNNFLRTLPVGFERLTRLDTLYLANNRFDKVPDAIFALLNLRFLDLSDNMIEDLPPAIARLRQLESLLLAYNKLTRLPDSICDMVSLHLLWVGFNRLRKLPVNFERLANLDWGINGHTTSLAVDGNPLIHPPVEVCRQGVMAIGDYTAQYAGRMAVTPVPGLLMESTSPRALLIRDRRPSPPSPPPTQTVLLERSYTPLVEIHPRYNKPISQGATLDRSSDVIPVSTPSTYGLTSQSTYGLTYYGTNGR